MFIIYYVFVNLIGMKEFFLFFVNFKRFLEIEILFLEFILIIIFFGVDFL